MGIDNYYLDLITKVSKSFGLTPIDNSSIDDEPHLYKVSIDGLHKYLHFFEFFWFENSNEFKFNVFVCLGFREMTIELSNQIIQSFANEKTPFTKITIDNAGFLEMLGAYKKDKLDGSLIREILSYYVNMSPTLKSLLRLVVVNGSDNKSKGGL